MKRVRSITPRASQVAAGQTYEYARQARARAFTLNRLEDFCDDHDLECRGLPRLLRVPGCRFFCSARTLATYARWEFVLRPARRDNQ